MQRLQNKIAIITGGAAGIGEVTARTFANEGAKVMIWDVNDQRGSVLAAELDFAEYYHVNVADSESVQAAVDDILKKHERIDILVNNAGITRDATLFKMEEAQWDAVIDVNLKGVFNCTKMVGAVMSNQRSGAIISTSSVVALYGNFGQTNYVAAKSGIIGMTKVWARELGRKSIRVNAVAPGFIATEMVKSVPEKVITTLEGKTPLGRLGQPQDIANAYLFLASEEASFVTGTVLSVDGGLIV